MFEEEAEKYATVDLPDGCTKIDYQKKADWQKGAEFGYNKANEWHNQDIVDIYDSIATDWSAKHYLCIMKDKRIVAAEGNCDECCNGEVGVNLFFEHDDEKYYIDDIVWWKEIELPKS